MQASGWGFEYESDPDDERAGGDPESVQAAAREALTAPSFEGAAMDVGSAALRALLVSAAIVTPGASLGKCSTHGRSLLYEGRGTELWMSCGAVPAPCEWRMA